MSKKIRGFAHLFGFSANASEDDEDEKEKSKKAKGRRAEEDDNDEDIDHKKIFHQGQWIRATVTGTGSESADKKAKR